MATPTTRLASGPHAEVHLPAGSAELEGPWDSAFWAHVPGQVRSKSNYRHKGKVAWAEITAFEDRVHAHARAARPAGWVREDAASRWPQRRPVAAFLLARSTLDTGNLSKSVFDACEGLLFVTDAQVLTCTETVYRTRNDPGLLMAYAQLPAGAGVSDGLIAAAALVEQLAVLIT